VNMCIRVRLLQLISSCYAELIQQSCTTLDSDVNALSALVYYQRLRGGYYSYYHYCYRGELECVTFVQNTD